MRRFSISSAVLAITASASVLGAPASARAAAPSSFSDALVITEIMYNPARVYDSRGEWVEVHNTSSAPVSLEGWTIGDDTYDAHRIGALTIASGERAVLARFGDRTRNGGVEVDYVYGDSMVLFNHDDRVVLRDADGALVDEVRFGDVGFPATNGRSLSFTGGDNADGAAWCASTTTLPGGDFGSPGAANQCATSAAELVITEIMNNPGVTDDELGEWFELTNVGSEEVDIEGFTVQDEDGESFVVGASHVVEPAGRVVFGTNGDRDLNGGVEVTVAYGAAMRLHNTLDELIVNDAAGIQVDVVRWDDGRTFPDVAGASMELVDPSADNTVGSNWCVATATWGTRDKGTPGTPGSCEVVPSGVVITEIMSDPTAAASERDGEWFEVTNVGAAPVVLDGHVLRTRSAEFEIESLTIEPGGRAVVGANADKTRNGGVDVDVAYDGVLTLFDNAGLIEIATPNGAVLDRVAYSVDRGFPMSGGRSIELRAAELDNAVAANWCAAQVAFGAGDHGTPGAAADCPELAPAPPLVISEIMRNPAATIDPLGEWVEIYNPTADPVDLEGWQVGDGGSERVVIGASLVIEPDDFVVIGRSGSRLLNGDVDVDLAVGPKMVLIDRADRIILSDPAGRQVDQVTWGGGSALPRPNGASIQRSMDAMRALADSSDVSGWCVADRQYGFGDRGTPGVENDCSRADGRAVVINEIHRDPAAEPDAQAEWVELHNTGTQAIDISGWYLHDDDEDVWNVPAGSPPIEPGGFLTLGRNGADLNGGVALDLLYGPEIILFNTADELVLLDADRAVVDRVAWDDVNGFPKVRGATMALRDPALDNSIGANWCASVTDQGNGDLGTPGSPNLCSVPDDPDPDDGGEATPAAKYAMFATAGNGCKGDVTIEASEIVVGSPIRSNGDVRAVGSMIDFRDTISHGGTLTLGRGARTTTVVHEPTSQPAPYSWSIEQFLPGGSLADGDGYTFHPGDLRVSGPAAALPPGLHVVDGDVTISTSRALLNGVTIVATGTIEVTAMQVALAPFAPALPTLFSAATGCGDGVKLSSSSLTVSGAVASPESRIEIRGSIVNVDGGALIGSSVSIAGSKVSVNGPAPAPAPPLDDLASG